MKIKKGYFFKKKLSEYLLSEWVGLQYVIVVFPDHTHFLTTTAFFQYINIVDNFQIQVLEIIKQNTSAVYNKNSATIAFS